MGQNAGCLGSSNHVGCPVERPFVVVGQVTSRGSLPVSSRYTSERSLEQDFAVDHKAVLGMGMSGEVKMARGRSDGKCYAVKSFSKKGIDGRRKADLKNEAEIYLSLDHPHVASLEMVYEDDKDLHLVMELLSGGEVYDRLRRDKMFSEELAADTVYQMLRAVAYLHAHRIAHRDLKLENFLYVSLDSNQLKLIDFGFAKFAEEGTKMSQACGSLHYVAPEVLAKSYTEKADMWSLGVITYMLLTGCPPFFGSDDTIVLAIRRGQVRWGSRWQKISNDAADFVKQLLVVDPSKRLSAQEALEHPWIKARAMPSPASIDARMFENLMDFSDRPKFHRNVLSLMAWSLSSEDRQEELRAQFLSIDTDSSGTISKQEFKEALAACFDIKEQEAEELFSRLDTDNNKELEYSEFIAPSILCGEVNGSILRKAFTRFDRDGDGSIDRRDLQTILGGSFSDAEIEELLREADTSGDGKLNFEEFFAHFHSSPMAEAPPRRRMVCCGSSEVASPTLESGSAAAVVHRAVSRPTLLGDARGRRRPPATFEKPVAAIKAPI